MSFNQLIQIIYSTTLIFNIIAIIGNFKIFAKANISPFKAIIPIYNNYLLYRISWKQPNAFFLWFACYFGGNIMCNSTSLIYNILGIICLLGSLYINFLQSKKLAQSFGHGLPFALGLFLLTPIFIFILGLSKDIYQGPQD